MPRALVLCTVLVVACGFQPAAAAVTEDVPVPGGTAAVAATLNIAPVPDRGRFISETARILYGLSGRRPIDADTLAQQLKSVTNSAAATDETVPVPLTTSVWATAIFHRRVLPADLVVAILSDRQAAYLCYGLAGLDDETLEYFADHPALLGELYSRAAPMFAAFSSSVRIRGGRVVTPGGDEAIALWETVLGSRVTSPDQFLSALYTEAEGRIAYLFDTIGQLDRARQRFALGLNVQNVTARLTAMQTLTATWVAGLGDWRVKLQPFSRQPFDATAVLMRVRTDLDGRPMAPASKVFWSHVFESSDLPEDPAKTLKTRAAEQPIDAAWLIAATTVGDTRTRNERLDQFAFGQRVFVRASAAEMPDVLVALRAVRRYQMLMVTLERMGIRAPAVYAAAARVASRMAPPDPARSFLATAQFQGALALLSRMRRVGSLDAVTTEQLLASLLAVPLNQYSQYLGAVARWLGGDLRRAIRPANTLEEAVLGALAGPGESALASPIEWEGQRYRLDLAAAEVGRLTRVRERQAGPTLDAAFTLATLARRLTAGPLTLENARAITTRVEIVADELSAQSRGPSDTGELPPGVVAPPNPRDMLARGMDVLAKGSSPPDTSRAARAAVEIADAADAVAAQALASWAYAVDIGDADGAALLPGDLSRRHDFGFGLRDSEQRLHAAWALPRQDVAPGVPWHVDGSLLGLDVGLATVALRRLSVDRSLDAPTLNSNERETFAVGYGLMNPFALVDTAQEAIAEAIARGRQRVLSLTEPDDLDKIAVEIEMDGWRLRAGRWTLSHERERLPSMFSLGELLVLGDMAREIDLDPWGTSAMISTGCVCTEMPRPGRWPILSGRPQIGLLATAVPDLNLRVATVLTELGLPARLAKYVLSAAVQDFVDEVRTTDPDDWLTMARAAAAVSRERIEDYVAAAAADGPLVPEPER